MVSYNQYVNADNVFEGSSDENRELFKRALSEAMKLKIREIEEETMNIEIPLPSGRYI